MATRLLHEAIFKVLVVDIMKAIYLIRLDDACPTMNHQNWNKVEELLDQYNIKPIVGVIPDNKDPDFSWDSDPLFWGHVKNWQEKGWEIALHGYHHLMHHPHDRKVYYQKSHSYNTEYAGVSLDEQKQMIAKGLEIFEENHVYTRCFFAPAHTYDKNTIYALKKSSNFRFVSDGYALSPYIKDGMVFIPSICDGPFSFPVGMFTYVFHPSMMTEIGIKNMEIFLNKEKRNIACVDDVLTQVQKKQGMLGHILENGIYAARGVRNMKKTFSKKDNQ